MEKLDLTSKSLRALAYLKKMRCRITYVDETELNFILIEHKTGDEYIDPHEDDVEEELLRLVNNFKRHRTIYNPKNK